MMVAPVVSMSPAEHPPLMRIWTGPLMLRFAPARSMQGVTVLVQLLTDITKDPETMERSKPAALMGPTSDLITMLRSAVMVLSWRSIRASAMMSFSFDPPSQLTFPMLGMQMFLISASLSCPRLHGNTGGFPHLAAMVWLRNGGTVGSLQAPCPPP